MTNGPAQIGALWVDGALSFLEWLCLSSFVQAGHPVRLFAFAPIAHLPDGVEWADAAAVMPRDDKLRHHRRGSVTLLSDVFRYHMLAQNDGMIWVDTDAYCVRPLSVGHGHVYGWESPQGLNCAVLGLPKGSDALARLVEMTRHPHIIPDWITGPDRDALVAQQAAGEQVHVSQMPWGVWGPLALTHVLQGTGDVQFAQPQDVFYPFNWQTRQLMMNPMVDHFAHVTPRTQIIHLYGSWMRRCMVNYWQGQPRPGSLLDRLLKTHGIDPRAHPLPLDPVAAPVPPLS